MLLIPVFDLLMYPYFKKIDRPLSMLFKIGLGFSFAALSMIAAAVVEILGKNILLLMFYILMLVKMTWIVFQHDSPFTIIILTTFNSCSKSPAV